MKAIVYTNYGTPDVLQLKEIEKPVPGDNEVLVKVHAASINSWDWDMVRGKPYIVRMWGLFKPKYKTPGSDIAGRVEAIGKNISTLKPGDEVFGDLCECGFGAFAEYVCAKEKALAHKSSAMSFEEAATIPQAGMMAVQGLLDVGKIKPGQKILINGGAGAVGTFAIQIAKLYGAEVTGVDSTNKLEMMLAMGYDHVIDYTKEDFTKNGNCYDLVLDVQTNRPIFAYARALTQNGVYATVGGSIGRLLLALLLRGWISITRKKNIRIVALKPNKDLAYMNELFEAGKMKPVIDSIYKLDKVPQAFHYFATGAYKGKIVITMC